MKKQVFKTELINEIVNRVKQGAEMKEIIEEFNMKILNGENNVGSISYNKGGYVYINLHTNLSPEIAKAIIEDIVSNIKIDVPADETAESTEAEQTQTTV